MEEVRNIVIECPVCDKRALHLMQDGEGLMQCLHCGYASSDKFQGDKENNDSYKQLSDDMKKMSMFVNDRTWVPTIMTLPMGVLNPILVEGQMFWSFAPMVEIPENERKNYPDDSGGFYENRYENEKAKLYINFNEALIEMNEQYTSKKKDLKLPKLKKADA